MKKTIIISCIALLFVVGVVSAVTMTPDEVKELVNNNTPLNFGGAVNASVDVIGTRTGTTTVAVKFLNNTATTTYKSFIGDEIDQATYTFYPVTASTTGANVQVEIFGSNDTACDTIATSTTDANYVATLPLVSDIHWFDLADNIRNLAGSVGFTTATGTMAWSPVAESGRQVTLDGLSTKCLRLGVSASSTSIWVQLTTKAY